MTCLDITTDHKWRPFKYDYEVPTKVLEDKYEHLKTDEGYEPDGYFKYRNNWYHLSDFATMPERDVTEK
ncbi:hypothetical protein [Rhizobium sp. CECT 9324]|nr:hypothetical protein [Rhizobium sp. CECT 9324]CAH0342322.1 hypothetical protein RHI9324_04045 [Rhizobium sp. CECT 9324]